jgi:hypothetical protein
MAEYELVDSISLLIDSSVLTQAFLSITSTISAQVHNLGMKKIIFMRIAKL